MNLEKNQLLYAGLIQVIRRGTAEILEETEEGIFLKDTVSGGFMLAVENVETGKEWLEKYSHLNHRLFVAFQKEIVDILKKEYGLSETMECYQAVYPSNISPVCENELQIRCAEKKDIETIMTYYHKLEEEELEKIIEGGDLFLGFQDEKMVGFVGKHLEGSMGLLEILPDYRRKGYGYIMESFLIDHMLKQNLIPFCQIEVDNEKSMALQRKIGMQISEEKMYWVF